MIASAHYVRCDTPGCRESAFSPHWIRRAAREQFEALGWTIRSWGTFCAKHGIARRRA